MSEFTTEALRLFATFLVIYAAMRLGHYMNMRAQYKHLQAHADYLKRTVEAVLAECREIAGERATARKEE